MGLLGELDKRSIGGILLTTVLILLLDYAFHTIYYPVGSDYFLGKILLVPIILFLAYKAGGMIGISTDLQIASLLGLSLAVNYYWQGTYTYQVQALFAIAHTLASYASLKLYEVIF